jgi:dienelactone hydrolase
VSEGTEDRRLMIPALMRPSLTLPARFRTSFLETSMTRTSWLLFVPLLLTTTSPLPAQDFLEKVLAQEIIGPRQTLTETQDYLEPRVPRLPRFESVEEWNTYAQKIRREVLDRVVFRGEAKRWRTANTQVKWLETIPGGPGYRIKKVRYEAVPGLWIPALLYEPSDLKGKVPVYLAVNGHDRKGKAAPYKQIRCINLAKRGMLVLNVEWLGMGQLATTGFTHYRMNQLDLCGTSGLAPFYLAMTRGIDLLLSLPNADPARVAVSGLSGGGWQTIVVSSLDERVTLSNPVAGYSSFVTRIHHHKDLGDSEQTPCDLATVADYTHLTCLRAPRPTLLTFNSKDQCCFEAGYALPPLLKAATPIFKRYGQEKALRSHVNDDPGTHNYEVDNRQAFYRMIGDFFYTGEKFDAKEIPSDKEVKSAEDLNVPLPENNQDFHRLALALARDLPRTPPWPTDKKQAAPWQAKHRELISKLLAARHYEAEAKKLGTEEKEEIQATRWQLKLGKDWTVPVLELVKGKPEKTAILLNDAGRKADPITARRLLDSGHRVLAVDLFYFGECRIASRDVLFALLVAAVGDRPLGLQASQLGAVARWARSQFGDGAGSVVAVGPRMGLISLAAATLEPKAITRLELEGSLGSLQEILERNRAVNQWPEVFCFGLLEHTDIKNLVATIAPREVAFGKPEDRVKKELAGLKEWYALLGKDFDPLK